MAGRAGKHKTVLRYGTYWLASADPLAVEFECIRRGGRFEDRGRMCGEGLPFHVKKAMRLLWPDDFWHRWCDLIVDTFLKEPGRTGCWGPSSTGKSWVFSKAALTMFYAKPKGTTVLISSTTRDDLQRRIWGYVMEADGKARERYPNLPGHFIESEMKLLADSKDVEGRSKRDGILAVACRKDGKWDGLASYVGSKNDVMILVCDECFTGDTLIDTPRGPKPISQIQPGEFVYNAAGVGVVCAVSERRPEALVHVRTRQGRTFNVTPNHPFLTQKGWVKACDLNQTHYMLATHEAMRMVSGEVQTKEESSAFLRKLLCSEMVAQSAGIEAARKVQAKKAETTLQTLWTAGDRYLEHLLQPFMQRELASCTTGMGGKEGGSDWASFIGSAQAQSGLGKENVATDEKAEPDARPQNASKGSGKVTREWPQADDTWRQRDRTYEAGSKAFSDLYGRYQQLCHPNISAPWQWLSNTLQSGLGVSRAEASGGVRRGDSQFSRAPIPRPQENSILAGDWVEGIAFYQLGSAGEYGAGDSQDKVYNLQVEGHPSYSVNGCLVHNCQFMPVGFLDALANLESNDPCYAAIMGNLPDVENPLGWACEPKNGWEALPDSDLSRVFETKWVRGRAIQLIGMDSPNMDFPEGQEPYKGLIGRRYIEQCRANYGSDTTKFHMFASGKVPKAGMHCTVFTKAECMKHNVSSTVVWGHEPLVRGYGLDAAYSGLGGDRTVGFPFVYGKDAQGKIRFQLGAMKVYPGSRDPKLTHAEAIAMECKAECEMHGIDPAHVFFDGTGRSELTSAFGRLWSSQVVPIEFGGAATQRPTFTGEKWRENERKDKQPGNYKLCVDVFQYFVSELWFALKHCIVADQMRGMPQEAIDEGSLRKFEIVSGGKERVESKDDMKERGLRSPDICDAIVAALEGARRLGFPLGKHVTIEKKRDNTLWLQAMSDRQWQKAKQEVLTA
jgi:hypothetical protein